MFNVGPLELMVLLAIALLVIGPKKLPEVGRSVGKGLREFKEAMGGMTGGRDDDSLKDLDWDEHGELRGPGGETADGERRRREDDEFERVQAEEEAKARQSFPQAGGRGAEAPTPTRTPRSR